MAWSTLHFPEIQDTHIFVGLESLLLFCGYNRSIVSLQANYF